MSLLSRGHIHNCKELLNCGRPQLWISPRYIHRLEAESMDIPMIYPYNRGLNMHQKTFRRTRETFTRRTYAGCRDVDSIEHNRSYNKSHILYPRKNTYPLPDTLHTRRILTSYYLHLYMYSRLQIGWQKT